MAIKAVVFDIGSVLEVIDDEVFPAPFETRHGLGEGAVLSVPDLDADPGTGGVSEAEVRAHWQRHLALSDRQVDELMRDFWTWYVGTLDQPLVDWFAAQRPTRKTGILSNSGPGAREAERHWGFEELTDDIVYSHEVGVAKPDPRIYELACARLGVEPHELVFLDDMQHCVDGAAALGIRALVHRSTPESIEAITALLA